MTTAIKERGILFNGDMVRAILGGLKVQTRRVVLPQPVPDPSEEGWWIWKGVSYEADVLANDILKHCNPHGSPGERLYVRETITYSLIESNYYRVGTRLVGTVETLKGVGTEMWRKLRDYQIERAGKCKTIPCIHMPRWASRILLEITGIRVERLRDISPEDCEAEGVQGSTHASPAGGLPYEIYRSGGLEYGAPNEAFLAGDWAEGVEKKHGENPWVWVIEFKRIP